MKKIYLFLVMCCLAVTGKAQTAASYGLTATTGTFASISGTGTAITSGGMISDNGVTTGIPVGFSFVYCGTTYTTVSASANGWFSLANSALGAAPSQTNATGSLASIAAGAGLLMPLWSDLYGVSQTAYYQTTGTAGSRIFTMEWKNWSVCCAAGTAVMNFQVKLYESSNTIEFWYGGYSGTVATTATIGIANTTSDYQTLPAGTSTFSNTAFNATCAPPANGTILRWCAPPPAITGGTVAFCSGTTTTLADAQAGGVWSSSTPSVATVGSLTGIVTGVTAGTATINYTPACGPSVSNIVTVTATPSTFTVTGGGPYCAGGSGVGIGLNGSTSTYVYSLYNGITFVNSVTGTGAAISFGSQTASGTYTVVATNGSCSAPMLGSATVTVNPLPTPFATTGGGSYCTGGAGLAVGLASTTIGVNYQLYLGATPIGAPQVGTSGAITFPLVTTVGTYTVSATNAFTGCTNAMTGSAAVSTYPLPVQYSVTGSGSFCLGGAGLPVGLPGSSIGTNYQLYYNGIPTGSPIAGTSSPISFGNQTAAGTYTVLGTIAATTCTVNMSGSAVVTVNPLPTVYTVYFPLGGTGAYCLGGAGQAVGLNGSQIGVNYQLYIGGSPVGSPVAGTGTAISFGLQTTVGSYTVVATNVATACSNNMFGSVAISTLPLPALFAVTGGGAYCAGGTGVAVGLASSTVGVNYSLYNSGTLVGAASGTGSAISFGLQLTAGTYNVIAVNATTGCTATMSGSVSVVVNPLPATFTVSGGGSYCSGGAGQPVNLSGSVTGVNYQLFRAGSLDTTVPGNGSPLSFGNRLGAGAYTAVAVNTTTTCSSIMTGSASISINPLPTVYAITGGGGYCAGGSGVNIGLTASTLGINYQLYNTSGAVGGPVAGTGSPLTFGLQTTPTTRDSVVATNTTTGCMANMSGNVPVSINALPTQFTVSGGGLYCFGSTNGDTIRLGGSVSGTQYQLYNGLALSGAPLTGTGALLQFTGVFAAGNYTITAINPATGCTNNMLGSANVTISPLPAVFAVTGGGTYCTGSAGVSVGLISSSVGISYQLYNNGVVSGSPLAGNNLPLTFGAETAPGSYSVVGTSATGCSSSMSGTAVVSVNALPAAFNITQSAASYCAGSPSVHVGTSGSAIGVSYQLFNGTTPVAAPLSGTGGTLDFGVQGAGSYTVIGTNTTTGCSKVMTGTATIISNALPTVYNINGGGGYCPGTPGVLVGLASSDVTASYQLYNGLTPVGGWVPGGAGTAISFGSQTVTGVYTVVAKNNSTSCVSNMAGSATVTLYPLPVIYNITGGGHYCVGGTGVNVGLGGSNLGVAYQLMNASAPVGTAISGTGLPLNFGLQTVTGAYTIVATSSTTTCSSLMNGTANVDTNSLPAAFNVTGTGAYCAGGAGLHVGIDGSVTGTLYQLVIGGSTPVGTLVAGTGSALDFGAQTAGGTYTVLATNTATTCTNNMNGNAVITINPLPSNTFSVTGGGPFCSGSAGPNILLSGSEGTATYRLVNGTTPFGSTVTGSGAGLTFGPVNTPGTYGIMATYTATGCVNLMSGTVNVAVNPLPNTYIVSGGGHYCSGGPGVHIALSGSNLGINYQLKLGTSLTGPVVAGTGLVIDFGFVTGSGTYTVQATNAATGCTNIMTGTAVVVIDPLPAIHTVVSTSSSYCAGSAGVAVSIDGSDTGINYQLYNGSTTVGFPNPGTGSPVAFGYITLPGSYHIVATNNSTGCFVNMAPGVTVTINSLPGVYSVTGGGSYCSGGTGVNIGLSGSASGISYQLYNGMTPAGSAVAGTGSAISFGLHTASGTYTVVATNTLTTCTNNMSGAATVVIKSLPLAYLVSGGGTYCAGGPGLPVSINASDLSVSYQLMRGTTPVGSPVTGMGSTVSFGNQTVAGTYTVSGTSSVTGCSNTMTGSAVISVNAAPAAFSVTGGGGYCPGGTGVNVGLSGSATGVNYQLMMGTTLAGIPVAGTGAAINFGLQTNAGAYSVLATNTSTGCTNVMSGSATVSVNALPATFNVVGGGSYCAGGAGVSVGLDNSASGINYVLYDGISSIGTLPGTGGPLNFGMQTLAGTYHILGTNAATGCSVYMADSAVVVVTPIVVPTVNITSGGGDTICSGTFTTFTAGATGAGTSPTYQWAVNGTPAASGSVYGYIPVNGDVISVALTSSAACAMPATATYGKLLTVNQKETPFVTVSANPGTEVCQGTLVNFTAMPNYGGSAPVFQWFKDGTNAGSGANFSYTPTNGDIVYVVMTSNYHCRLADNVSSTHTTMTVDLPTLPVVVIAANPGSSIAYGQTVTLSTTVSNGGPAPTYQWLINGTPVAGATNASFSSNTFANRDSVTCQVLSSGGCPGLLGFNSITMHVANVGVSGVAENEDAVKLVPNPNNGVFTVTGAISYLNSEVSIEVVNMLGQIVYTEKVIVTGGAINTQIHLDNSLAKGTYILNLRSEAGNKTIHFILDK